MHLSSQNVYLRNLVYRIKNVFTIVDAKQEWYFPRRVEAAKSSNSNLTNALSLPVVLVKQLARHAERVDSRHMAKWRSFLIDDVNSSQLGEAQ